MIGPSSGLGLAGFSFLACSRFKYALSCRWPALTGPCDATTTAIAATLVNKVRTLRHTALSPRQAEASAPTHSISMPLHHNIATPRNVPQNYLRAVNVTAS